MRTVFISIMAFVALCCVGKPSRAKQYNIEDYVNWYLVEPEGDLMWQVYDAWQLYKADKPQPDGVRLVVDKSNGYMCYENTDEEYDSSIVMEMCYWNCADGKHRLIASNVVTKHNGYVIDGQYDGVVFFIETKSTH